MRNEAAERLREWLDDGLSTVGGDPRPWEWLDEALAAERRAALQAYVKWLEDNGHEIRTFQDYGDRGDESIRCAAKGCYAERYDWDSTHLRAYVLEMTGVTL